MRTAPVINARKGGSRKTHAKVKPAAKPSGRGASIKTKAPRGSFSVRGFISQHFDACTDALARLGKQPIATALTLLVIGIALALPAGLQLLVQNARLISGEWASAVDLSVYVAPGTEHDAVLKLGQTIESNPLVDGIIVLSAEQAMVDFKSLSGFSRALETLDQNPLPATIIVRPNALDEDPELIKQLANTLRALPHVDHVQLDTEWVERFLGILDVVRRSVFVAATLLALAVLVIVGNTIRVEIQQRRDEIEITKLVGGSDAFIRRPFVYTGIWYGALGGVIAVLLVSMAVFLIDAPVSRVAGLYGSEFALRGLVNYQWLWLILIAMALGALGSWAAANRHLRQIEPS